LIFRRAAFARERETLRVRGELELLISSGQLPCRAVLGGLNDFQNLWPQPVKRPVVQEIVY